MAKVKCAVCGKPPQVASMVYKLYIHDCEVTLSRWFTNGLIWSNSWTNIKGERRGRVS